MDFYFYTAFEVFKIFTLLIFLFCILFLKRASKIVYLLPMNSYFASDTNVPDSLFKCFAHTNLQNPQQLHVQEMKLLLFYW